MKRKWIVYGAVVFSTGLILAGCAGGRAQSKVRKGELLKTMDTPEVETNRYVEFDGIGAADQSIQNISQKRSLSEAAGRKVAEEKLLSYLKGEKIDASTTVEQAITTNQKIRGIVENTLRGVAIVKREWTSDDGCMVTIRLDKKKFLDQIKGQAQ